MGIISQIFSAFAITSLTGMLADMIYRIYGRYQKDSRPEVRYGMLRTTCLLYLLPLGYVLMQLTVRDGYVQYIGMWQINFGFAGVLWVPGLMAAGVWLTLTIRCLMELLTEYRKQRALDRSNVPVGDEEVQAEFLRIKEKLGVRGVRLYQNNRRVRPHSRGVFFCSVILPEQSYTKEQLSVIFHHELMHVKHRDGFYKLCGICITAVQHLNPLVKDLMEEIDEWSEYYCDMRAIEAISDEMEAGRYFEVIIDSAGDVRDMTEANYIFSMLYESQLRLERRIEYMKKYKKQRRVMKGIAVLFSFTFVMLNVTTIYAAGSVMSSLHDRIYQSAEMTDGESSNAAVLKEFYIPAAEDNSYDRVESGEAGLIAPLLDAEELVSFQWSVSPGTRVVSGTFYVKAGQKISISATASPGGIPFWIGIQDGWNNVRYVEGYDTLSHSFEIENSGNYRVLVQNRGTIAITAVGGYKYN